MLECSYLDTWNVRLNLFNTKKTNVTILLQNAQCFEGAQYILL